jgi:hypothetical protein
MVEDQEVAATWQHVPVRVDTVCVTAITRPRRHRDQIRDT